MDVTINKALIVDDNEINRFVMGATLEDIGQDYDLLSDGSHVLNHIQSHPRYNIIFMDIHMPILNGYETTKVIRHYESIVGLERTPIIGVTADAGREVYRRCLNEGMDDCIFKPISVDRIRGLIEKYCNKVKD
jgi:CheY-like chemotaxis protein